MSSGRKSSVMRHIKNYNIHKGLGQVISFVEYSVGRSEGKYRPQLEYESIKPQVHFLKNMSDKTLQELENLIVKEIAKRFYERMSKDQTMLDNIEARLKPDIALKISDL
jgi:hypothetical protein